MRCKRRRLKSRITIICLVTIVAYILITLNILHYYTLNINGAHYCGWFEKLSNNLNCIKSPSPYANWTLSTPKVWKSNQEATPIPLNFEKIDLEKMDWNDHDFQAIDAKRRGPGEQGKALVMPLSKEEKDLSDKLFDEYKFNAFVSDKISVERAIEDTRTPACKSQHFIKNIPKNSVSVIVVFHNERTSTILRTIHSIVNRTPATLLREIILVDDLSVKEELKAPLELYISKHFNQVKIIRNQKRLGLIKSRIAGADASTGTFLVFFDAHVEVNSNYLPPLLEPIVLNYRTISCPMIDFIHGNSFQIIRLNQRIRGAFDWSLKYVRLPIKAADETTPHASPVMIGCAFAISRAWWNEVEKFDPGLEIWGGEQFELSFKSWMCGGSVVDAPCSRVAHLFRELPYLEESYKNHTTDRNLLRVATVWMDNYIKHVFERKIDMQGLDLGNLTRQYELKSRLNCKSFTWFLENVAPDLMERYPVIEPTNTAWGRLRSYFNISMCLTTIHKQVFLVSCDKEPQTDFTFDWRYHIRSSTASGRCLINFAYGLLSSQGCTEVNERPSEMFAWDQSTGHIVNFETHSCLDFELKSRRALINVCDKRKLTQMWTFDNFNSTQALKGWLVYKSNTGGDVKQK